MQGEEQLENTMSMQGEAGEPQLEDTMQGETQIEVAMQGEGQLEEVQPQFERRIDDSFGCWGADDDPDDFSLYHGSRDFDEEDTLQEDDDDDSRPTRKRLCLSLDSRHGSPLFYAPPSSAHVECPHCSFCWLSASDRVASVDNVEEMPVRFRNHMGSHHVSAAYHQPNEALLEIAEEDDADDMNFHQQWAHEVELDAFGKPIESQSIPENLQRHIMCVIRPHHTSSSRAKALNDMLTSASFFTTMPRVITVLDLPGDDEAVRFVLNAAVETLEPPCFTQVSLLCVPLCDHGSTIEISDQKLLGRVGVELLQMNFDAVAGKSRLEVIPGALECVAEMMIRSGVRIHPVESLHVTDILQTLFCLNSAVWGDLDVSPILLSQICPIVESCLNSKHWILDCLRHVGLEDVSEVVLLDWFAVEVRTIHIETVIRSDCVNQISSDDSDSELTACGEQASLYPDAPEPFARFASRYIDGELPTQGVDRFMRPRGSHLALEEHLGAGLRALQSSQQTFNFFGRQFRCDYAAGALSAVTSTVLSTTISILRSVLDNSISSTLPSSVRSVPSLITVVNTPLPPFIIATGPASDKYADVMISRKGIQSKQCIINTIENDVTVLTDHHLVFALQKVFAAETVQHILGEFQSVVELLGETSWNDDSHSFVDERGTAQWKAMAQTRLTPAVVAFLTNHVCREKIVLTQRASVCLSVILSFISTSIIDYGNECAVWESQHYESEESQHYETTSLTLPIPHVSLDGGMEGLHLNGVAGHLPTLLPQMLERGKASMPQLKNSHEYPDWALSFRASSLGRVLLCRLVPIDFERAVSEVNDDIRRTASCNLNTIFYHSPGSLSAMFFHSRALTGSSVQLLSDALIIQLINLVARARDYAQYQNDECVVSIHPITKPSTDGLDDWQQSALPPYPLVLKDDETENTACTFEVDDDDVAVLNKRAVRIAIDEVFPEDSHGINLVVNSILSDDQLLSMVTPVESDQSVEGKQPLHTTSWTSGFHTGGLRFPPQLIAYCVNQLASDCVCTLEGSIWLAAVLHHLCHSVICPFCPVTLEEMEQHALGYFEVETDLSATLIGQTAKLRRRQDHFKTSHCHHNVVPA